jgi:phage terminase large subunit-like protein
MIEGESGLLSVFPEHQRPKYFPGKRRIVFHTGAVATVLSAEKPDQLRGPQCDTYWGDEFCFWSYIKEAWDNLMFGFRLGNPKGIMTTTPRNLKLLKEIIEYNEVVVTGGSSYDNLGNLAASYRLLIDRYAGTTIGKQEVQGLILQEVKGALWKLKDFDNIRVEKLPPPDEIKKIIVSVDPSVSDDEGDDCGIINLALGYNQLVYIFGDKTDQYTTNEWGQVVRNQVDALQADYALAEINNGGALVTTEIQLLDKSIPVHTVHASRGKQVRATPVHSLYEKNIVRHVGALPELEDEMSTWVPGNKSPNRLDAMVHGVTDLYGLGQPDSAWWNKSLKEAS